MIKVKNEFFHVIMVCVGLFKLIDKKDNSTKLKIENLQIWGIDYKRTDIGIAEIKKHVVCCRCEYSTGFFTKLF